MGRTISIYPPFSFSAAFLFSPDDAVVDLGREIRRRRRIQHLFSADLATANVSMIWWLDLNGRFRVRGIMLDFMRV